MIVRKNSDWNFCPWQGWLLCRWPRWKGGRSLEVRKSGDQEARKFEGSARGSTNHPSKNMESYFRAFLFLTSMHKFIKVLPPHYFLLLIHFLHTITWPQFLFSPGVTSDLVSSHWASLLQASVMQAPVWWLLCPSWPWPTRQSPSSESAQGPTGAGPAFSCSCLVRQSCLEVFKHLLAFYLLFSLSNSYSSSITSLHPLKSSVLTLSCVNYISPLCSNQDRVLSTALPVLENTPASHWKCVFMCLP